MQSGLSFSQIQKIDSLHLALKKANNDTALISALNNLGNYYSKALPDSAFSYFFEAKKICEKNINGLKNQNNELNLIYNTYLKKYGKTLSALGWAFSKKNNHKASIQFYNQSITIYTAVNNKIGIADSYFGLGHSYGELGEIDNAIISMNKCTAINESLGDKKKISNSLNNLGILYESLGKIKEALEVNEKCLKICESIKDNEGVARVLLNLGVIYAYQGQNDVALEYSNKSLKIHLELADKKGIAFCVNNIASIYYNLKKFDKSLAYYQRSLKLSEDIGDKSGILLALNNICSSYVDMGEYETANKYLEKIYLLAKEIGSKTALNQYYSSKSNNLLAENKLEDALEYSLLNLKLSNELGDLESARLTYNKLKNIYQIKGNYKKSYEMFQSYISLNDSIHNEENRDAALKTHIKNEFEKKLLADSINLSDTKKLAASRLSESIAKLKQQKTQRFALIGGLIILLAFSIVIFNRFKTSQKQKHIIEIQKQIVDASQKKTIDSINYAKKIQNSILPSHEELSSFFPHHFIFFKPKDIVSGDFYWFHHHNNLSFFAVADCTGHGVPGAFMTMIAHSSLIEVVVEQKLTAPDKILSSLHHLIFKNLQQQRGDEYSQDGMDISLAIIDHENNLLHFSGAYNHGYLIDDKEIRTLKSTQKSIGGLSILAEIEPERSFTSESFQINKNTLLILSTDGIFDQLNKADEKFGNTRFKEMVLKLNSNQPSDNLKIVELTFNTWIEQQAQLDDVLLMGIKI